MSEHLSSEQVSRWMMGERRGPEEEHVRECANCRAELNKMETTLAEFRRSVWWLGDRKASAVEIGQLRQRSLSRPLRWVLAAAAVLILATTPLFKNARDRQRDAADKLLMDQVDEAISRRVPRPMEPLIELVQWGGPTEGKEIKR